MAEEIFYDELEQAIISTRKNLEYDAKDEDLIVAINKAIQDSKPLKEKMDEAGRRNKMFWVKGTEKDLSRLHPAKSKIISNRIFSDVETAVPILTSEPPEPTVIGENITNELQVMLQEGLKIAYEVKYKMQQKLQCLIRHWFLFRLGVIKYRWDKDKGFLTENVLPRKIGIDPRSTSLDNCEYIFEQMEDTFENIQSKFKSKKKELTNLFGDIDAKTKVKYIEFWGGNGAWVCWKLRGMILDKKKNPNWNYDDEESNIFDNPHFPYILLNVFALGDETGMYDETSLIEESIPLQEGVNQLEQQILDLNEGQKRVWVVSGEAMSEGQAQALVNKTGDLLCYLDRKMPVGGIQQVQSGKPDASLFNHLNHLLSEIDNVLGIHSTTRGERKEQETLGGRQLLMASDYGRLDLIVRNVEQVMEEWYNAYLQMLKVYSVEAEVLSDGKTKVELIPQQIPSNILIMVKKGSTLPIDQRSKAENAIKLANLLSPKTVYEEMGYPNPDQIFAEFVQWLQMTGKIMPQGQMQGQGQGQGQEDIAVQQLMQLRQIIQSPQFQQLSPEEQAEMTQKAEQIRQGIKNE